MYCKPYIQEGMQMNAQDYWRLFMETGAPEAYLLYTRQVKTEDSNVFDDSGNRASGNRLQ